MLYRVFGLLVCGEGIVSPAEEGGSDQALFSHGVNLG
jgi:hypothetical protein